VATPRGAKKTAAKSARRAPAKSTKAAKATKSTKPTKAAKAASSKSSAASSGSPSAAKPSVAGTTAEPRDELVAPRDVGRLLHYGERFGASKIDIRMLPQQLAVATAGLALCDPGVPKGWRVLDRPVTAGRFRVMLSIARRFADGSSRDASSGARREGSPDQLAAFVVHTGQPPIARWTVAHAAGRKKPRSAEELPRVEVTTGWLVLVDAGDGSPGPLAVPATPAAPGFAPVEIPLTDGRTALAVPCANGAYAAYWAVDATDRPVCLVVDFDVFTQKDWKSRPT
jgi:hypothetical protein